MWFFNKKNKDKESEELISKKILKVVNKKPPISLPGIQFPKPLTLLNNDSILMNCYIPEYICLTDKPDGEFTSEDYVIIGMYLLGVWTFTLR